MNLKFYFLHGYHLLYLLLLLLECNEYGEPIDENGAVINEEDDNSNYRIKLYSKSKETGSGVNKKTYYSKGGKEPKENTDGAYVFAIPMNKAALFAGRIVPSSALMWSISSLLSPSGIIMPSV